MPKTFGFWKDMLMFCTETVMHLSRSICRMGRVNDGKTAFYVEINLLGSLQEGVRCETTTILGSVEQIHSQLCGCPDHWCNYGPCSARGRDS
mmetsp:Transcript_63811/g.149585  ORF Transcript_63811/g.149585 Transcript_63811/m.149585 type:complete len:92 (+) Transcript_63811:261-536(+)